MSSEKILIVDDEENILELIDIELKREGYKVLKARTGDEAIQLVKSLPPDLILMDVMLPDMDGGEAVRTIRRDERFLNIPVIFLTGMIDESEEEHTINIDGRIELAIAKPINFPELLKEVRNVFEK